MGIEMEHGVPFEAFSFVAAEKLDRAALRENLSSPSEGRTESISLLGENTEALGLVVGTRWDAGALHLILFPLIDRIMNLAGRHRLRSKFSHSFDESRPDVHTDEFNPSAGSDQFERER